MGSQESDNQKSEWEVRMSLPSDTPVVGCEINPYVIVTAKGFAKPPPYSLSFSWYSMQIPCSIHKNKKATHQCQECMLSGKSIESYHCSPECFLDDWKKHMSLHRFVLKSENNNESLEGQVEKVWIEVGSSRTYEPSFDDFGCELKLESMVTNCLKGNPLSLVNTIITQPVIRFPAHHPRRVIEIRSVHDLGNINLKCQSSDDFTFTLLSYNILADLYTKTRKYKNSPKWALIWENRRQNLLDEIVRYNADILCLQEVQRDHLQSFFMPRLNDLGYSFVYKEKKDSEVYTGNQHTSDGCAIFYRSKLFKLIVKYEFRFKEKAQSLVEALLPDKQDKGKYRLLKDNVAIVVTLEVLKNKASKSSICVANTHICAQAFPDVKLLQISNLIHKLEEIVDSQVPILICGDFNSRPGSDAHTFLVKGRIDSPQQADADPYGVYQFLKLQHSLTIASAYAILFDAANTKEVEEQLSKMDHGNREPLFTFVKPESAATLDYIFYTVNNLRVEGLLELLDRETLLGGIPSPEWPSDHIALMASFGFK